MSAAYVGILNPFWTSQCVSEWDWESLGVELIIQLVFNAKISTLVISCWNIDPLCWLTEYWGYRQRLVDFFGKGG